MLRSISTSTWLLTRRGEGLVERFVGEHDVDVRIDRLRNGPPHLEKGGHHPEVSEPFGETTDDALLEGDPDCIQIVEVPETEPRDRVAGVRDVLEE